MDPSAQARIAFSKVTNPKAKRALRVRIRSIYHLLHRFRRRAEIVLHDLSVLFPDKIAVTFQRSFYMHEKEKVHPFLTAPYPSSQILPDPPGAFASGFFAAVFRP